MLQTSRAPQVFEGNARSASALSLNIYFLTITYFLLYADMAELADALDSGTIA